MIAIVDANLEEHLSEEAEYILASEVANAGEIILSHADEISAEQADTTVAHLNRALEQIKCPRRVDKEVLRKSTLDLNEEDFNRLISCGYQMESYRKLDMEEKKGFESVYFMNVKMTEEQLKAAVEKLMNDRECGEIFRVKGFLQKEDGSWIQLNATHNGITMNPIEKGQEVIIVIGEGLKEQAIKRCHILRYGKIKVKKWKCESKIQFKNAENCSCHTIQIPRCDHRSQKDSKNRYCRDQRIFHSTVLYPQTDHKTHQLNPDSNGYISYDIQCFFHPNLLSPYLLHPYVSL